MTKTSGKLLAFDVTQLRELHFESYRRKRSKGKSIRGKKVNMVFLMHGPNTGQLLNK